MDAAAEGSGRRETVGGSRGEVTLANLYALRVAYAFLGFGLLVFVWPVVLVHSVQQAGSDGVRFALLGGIGLAALLGLRYPLQMLPLLLFELIWKTVYALAFALPLWLTHRMTDVVANDFSQIAVVVVIVPLIPWRYVVRHFVLQRGDRWR